MTLSLKLLGHRLKEMTAWLHPKLAVSPRCHRWVDISNTVFIYVSSLQQGTTLNTRYLNVYNAHFFLVLIVCLSFTS